MTGEAKRESISIRRLKALPGIPSRFLLKSMSQGKTGRLKFVANYFVTLTKEVFLLGRRKEMRY